MVRVGGGAGGWEMVQTAVEAHEDDLHSPYWEGVREAAAARLGR
jgi:predicted glycosyltransferase